MKQTVYSTLVDSETLQQHLDDPGWMVIDCRFKLADPESGRRVYHQSHIPGALYVHLDEDLSAPVERGKTGRHPLPSIEQAVQVFSRFGIEKGIQVVAYDDMGGALAAARLWWMLRWLGHREVAVLDGGWQAWLEEGRPIEQKVVSHPPGLFIPMLQPDLLVTAEHVEKIRLDPAYRLLDARSTERYYGINETLDPLAGHIPGAISAPYSENLSASGRFKEKVELGHYYQSLLGNVSPEQSIFYCGSGVSAILNILAMEVAGLPGARLYAGSWSEWITDLDHPISVGDQLSR
jgi:thiosulfate/3-mercaptopyruvate sulfurtransferase